MFPTTRLVILSVFVACCMARSGFANNFTTAKLSIVLELQKRGFHEEFPLIYMADDHPLEFYWLPSYYPTRK